MTKKNRSSLSTRGFTLLEVLIAVLIVGIIATAALPMLGSYTEKAREAREEANMVVKAQAIDRYNMDHQASLGTVYDPSDSTLVTYGLETMQGPSAQLLLPTDANGNVVGDPMTSNPGPYSYGPYLAELPPEPASLLLAIRSGEEAPPLFNTPMFVSLRYDGEKSYISFGAARVPTGRKFLAGDRKNVPAIIFSRQRVDIDPRPTTPTRGLDEGEEFTIFSRVFLALDDLDQIFKQRGMLLVPIQGVRAELRELQKTIGDKLPLVRAMGAKTFYEDRNGGGSPFVDLLEADAAHAKQVKMLDVVMKGKPTLEQRAFQDLYDSWRKGQVLKLTREYAWRYPDEHLPQLIESLRRASELNNEALNLKLEKWKSLGVESPSLDDTMRLWARSFPDILTAGAEYVDVVARRAAQMRMVALGGKDLTDGFIPPVEYDALRDRFIQTNNREEIEQVGVQAHEDAGNNADLIRANFARIHGIASIDVDPYMAKSVANAKKSVHEAASLLIACALDSELEVGSTLQGYSPTKDPGFGFMNLHVWFGQCQRYHHHALGQPGPIPLAYGSPR